MQLKSFFRWIPSAIILWAFAVFFILAAGNCLVDAIRAAHGHADPYYTSTLALIRESQQMVQWLLRGAIADTLVSALCILGWYLMRRRRSTTIACGGICVVIAVLIISQRSLIYLIRGAGFLDWGDLVIELPLLLYVVVHAYLAYRTASADSCSKF
jgi:uncharacterized membrane protein YfcA